MKPEAFDWFVIQSYWKVYGLLNENSQTIYDEKGCLKKEIYMAYFQKEDKK